MFCWDYPRGLVNGFWFCWFPAFDALPVAPALAIAFLLARLRRPVSLLRLRPRPFPRRLPAADTAIPLVRLPRMKALIAPFEQTTACACPAGHPPPGLLLLAWLGTILGRAHGR